MRNFFITLCLFAVIGSAIGATTIERNDYYRGAEVISEIELPKPVVNKGYPLELLLRSRGGSVELSADQTNLTQLSQIFWAGYGIVDPTLLTRSVESYDDGYSLLLYLVTNDSVYVYVPGRPQSRKDSGY